MADERLRELERRFRETGALEDEVAWLRERLRAGATTDAGAALAAFVGHGAARALLGERGVCVCGITREGEHLKRCALYPTRMHETPDALRIPPQLKQWARAFEAHGPEAAGRAAIALGRAVADTLSETKRQAALALLGLAETWLLCPCDEHRDRLLEDTVGRARQLPYHGPTRAIWSALWGSIDGWRTDAQPPAGARVREAATLAKKALSEKKARRAIYDELVPWALGLGDPLRERNA